MIVKEKKGEDAREDSIRASTMHQEEEGSKISTAKGTVNGVPQEGSINDGKIAGADTMVDGIVDLEITKEE